jgi:hypothetical protein
MFNRVKLTKIKRNLSPFHYEPYIKSLWIESVAAWPETSFLSPELWHGLSFDVIISYT